MSKLFKLEPFWRVLLHEFALSAESLTRRAGLPTNLFASSPTFVDLNGWASLWDALEDELDEPNLVLQLGQFLTLDMFDPAVFAAFCSKNLQQAAYRLQLYKRLVGPCRLELDDSQGLVLSCHVLGLPYPPELWATGELVLWVELVRHTTRHRVIPKQVTMPIAPKDPASFESYFGVSVTHGPRYELAFNEVDATRAFLSTDTSMWSFFEPMLRRRLAELDENTQTTERVSVALLELLPSGRSQLSDVARTLGVSVRTLQRRLGQEDTTYSDVLNHTRMRLANHYLTKTQLAITEVAFLVGYDDPNSFYPAFRSWTGMTPQDVRSTTGLVH